MFHISLSKLGYDINYHKNPQNSYFIQFYYHILFKAQEYLCLAIFEKPMIQVHGKTILSMEFKSMIKTHNLNPWQFIYPKPNSHWQHQSPILISNIKDQFSLATSKPNSHWQYQKYNLRWHYLKPNFHWQHQSPILIGDTKSPILIGNIKAQFSLAISKVQANYLALFYQKPKVIKYSAKYYIIIISLKSPIITIL